MPDDDPTPPIERLRRIYQDEDTDPPAGWDAVTAFEAEHRITLPEPFREFVATVTTGGPQCGPPYDGLTTLDGAGSGYADTPVVLQRPFPLTTAWRWDEEPDTGPPGVSVDDVLGSGYLRLGEAEEFTDWVLVVSGAHRGHMWILQEGSAAPFGREFGFTTAASGFLGWNEHWHADVRTYGYVDWHDVVPDAPEVVEAGPERGEDAPVAPGGITPLTPAQRVEALRAGKAARRRQGALGVALAEGRVTLAEVFAEADADPVVAKMTVESVLRNVPGLGDDDVAALLERVDVSRMRRIGYVGARVRNALLAELEPPGQPPSGGAASDGRE